MNRYTIKFSILSKHMKVSIEAESGPDAVRRFKELVEIKYIEKESNIIDKDIQNIKQMFNNIGINL